LYLILAENRAIVVNFGFKALKFFTAVDAMLFDAILFDTMDC